MAAFRPEDLPIIYKKLHWLDSMCYPEYDKDLQYKSGPVVKIRVGDVLNSLGEDGLRGIPAIINSVSKDYTDSPWELEEGLIVPRHVKVTVSLSVLHEKPIGIGVNGNFGGVGVYKDGIFKSNTNPDDLNNLAAFDTSKYNFRYVPRADVNLK
jgi:hypothetical protein